MRAAPRFGRGRAWNREIIALGALFVLLAPPSKGDTKNGAVVLLAADPGTKELAAKLSAELVSHGYAVAEYTEEASTEASREARAREVEAEAILHVVDSTATIEVRLIPKLPKREDFHGEVLSEGTTEEEERVAVLRAVELLHAGLLQAELPVAQAPPPLAPPTLPSPPRRTEPPPKPKMRSWALSLAPALVASPGSSPTFGGAFGSKRAFSARFAASGFALGTLLPARVNDGTNAAELSEWSAGLGFDWLTRFGNAWELNLGAGLGFAWLHASGTAAPPLASTTRETVVALPFLETGVAYALSDTLSLAFDVRAGFALPRPLLRFDGVAVAEWGRPLLSMSFGPVVKL